MRSPAIPNTLLMLLITTRLATESTISSTLPATPALENSMKDSSTISRQFPASKRRASLSNSPGGTETAVGLFGVTTTAVSDPHRRADSANASTSSSNVPGSSGKRLSPSGAITSSYSLNEGVGIVRRRTN